MLSSPTRRPRGDRATRLVLRGGLLVAAAAGAWFVSGVAAAPAAHAAELGSSSAQHRPGLIEVVGGVLDAVTGRGGSDVPAPGEQTGGPGDEKAGGKPGGGVGDQIGRPGGPDAQPRPGADAPDMPAPIGDAPAPDPGICEGSTCDHLGGLIPPTAGDQPTQPADQGASPAADQPTTPRGDRAKRASTDRFDRVADRYAGDDAADQSEQAAIPDVDHLVGIWTHAAVPMDFPAGLYGGTPFAAAGGGNAATGIPALTGFFVLDMADRAGGLSSAADRTPDESQLPMPARIAKPSVSPD